MKSIFPTTPSDIGAFVCSLQHSVQVDRGSFRDVSSIHWLDIPGSQVHLPPQPADRGRDAWSLGGRVYGPGLGGDGRLLVIFSAYSSFTEKWGRLVCPVRTGNPWEQLACIWGDISEPSPIPQVYQWKTWPWREPQQGFYFLPTGGASKDLSPCLQAPDSRRIESPTEASPLCCKSLPPQWAKCVCKTGLCVFKNGATGHGEQTCACQGGGDREVWIRSLGLADISYCIKNRYTTRSYYRAQGSVSNILW